MNDNVIPLRRSTDAPPPSAVRAQMEAATLLYRAASMLIGGEVRITAVARHPSGPVATVAAVCTDKDGQHGVTYNPRFGYSCTCGPDGDCPHIAAVDRVVHVR